MIYDSNLGIFGNIKRLFEEADNTNNTVWQNKCEAEQTNLQTQADIIESVIDEYNALVE